MDLCQVNPEFNLYDPEWPLRTYQPQAPPAKFVFAEEGRRCGQALDSIISNGCIISGSRVTGSILCPNVRVHSFCDIEQSILMPGVRVGRHARIRRAIIDRDVLIPRGALIGYDPEEDRRRHTVTEGGVVVVTADDEPLIGRSARKRCAPKLEADRGGPRRTDADVSASWQTQVARCRSRAFTGARFSIRAATPPWKSTSGPATHSAARPCRRARRPASARRSSCATATRRGISAKACARPSRTSTARSPRRCVGQPLDQRAIDAR